MNEARIALARKWATVYRELGYQPLPSRPDDKRPMCRFADLWETPAPDDLFDRFPTTNVQVMTGRHWNLCVLDLDGAAALEHVASHWRPLPRTWTSFHSGGGAKGRHLWFRLPEGLRERRKSLLWSIWDPDKKPVPGWTKHLGIELLCDRSLVVAPPSIHPTTRNAYGFERGLSPFEMKRPALLPDWVWAMTSVEPERRPIVQPVLKPRKSVYDPTHSALPYRVEAAHLLGLIPDKVGIAVSWGLRLARGGSGGWLYCHAIDREDENPSAQFHAETGRYWTAGQPSIGFFDLGAALGVYRDWRECRDDMAARYHLELSRGA